MGQTSSSACKDLLPDAINFQITKHTKILSELNNLTFEEFQDCVKEINDLCVALTERSNSD